MCEKCAAASKKARYLTDQILNQIDFDEAGKLAQEEATKHNLAGVDENIAKFYVAALANGVHTAATSLAHQLFMQGDTIRDTYAQLKQLAQRADPDYFRTVLAPLQAFAQHEVDEAKRMFVASGRNKGISELVLNGDTPLEQVTDEEFFHIGETTAMARPVALMLVIAKAIHSTKTPEPEFQNLDLGDRRACIIAFGKITARYNREGYQQLCNKADAYLNQGEHEPFVTFMRTFGA